MIFCLCDRMVVGFATNYAISAYPHYSCQLKSRSRKVFSIQRLQGTCDKSEVFSETPVSSTNKLTMYMYHDILFINKHTVWRSIYVPYIFHLRNSENIQGRGVYGHGV
jgi:hypothetical protein